VLLLQTAVPVAWSPTVVCDGEDANRGVRFEVDHVVRKAFDWRASNRQVEAHVRYARASTRQADDSIERGVDGLEELDAEPRATLIVPASGTRRRLRPRTERVDSPLGQVRFRASPDVFPDNAWRLSRKNATGASFNLCGPLRFEACRVQVGAIQAGKQFGGYVRAFFRRQSQRFAK
jgi:hypothetical protein